MLSCSLSLGVSEVGRNCARASCARCRAGTRGLCAQQWFGLSVELPGYRSSGVAVSCGLIHQRGWGHPLPVVVTHALVVAEACAWVRARRVARCTARLRFELCDQSAAPCAQCCVRMRIKSTRLSIPVATRMCTGSANIQTAAVC
jgi:hypothetical protein